MVAGNAAISTMAVRILGLLINLCVLALVGRYADQASLGIVIVLNAAAFVGGVVCSAGLPTWILRAISEHRVDGKLDRIGAEYERAFKKVRQLSTFTVMAASVTAYAQHSGLVPEIGVFGALETCALGVCSAALGVQLLDTSLMRSLKRPVLAGAFQFCSQPLCLLISLIALSGVAGETSRIVTVFAITAGIVLNAVVVHCYLRCCLNLPTRSVYLDPIDERSVRSFWMLSLVGSASAQAPLIVAAVMLSPSAATLIGIPFRICNLPMTIVAALGSYYAPSLREAFIRSDISAQRRDLLQSQWLGGLFVTPLVVVSWVAPERLLDLFSASADTGPILLRMFSVAQLAIASCGVSEQHLAMIGREKTATIAACLCLFTVMVTGCLLSSVFGALGVGGVWIVASVVRQFYVLSASRSALQASAL